MQVQNEFDRMSKIGEQKANSFINKIWSPVIFNIFNKIEDTHSVFDYVIFQNGNTGTTGNYVETKNRDSSATGYTHFILEKDKINRTKEIFTKEGLISSSFYYLNTFDCCDFAYLWHFNNFKQNKNKVIKAKEELNQHQINQLIKIYGKDVILSGKKKCVDKTANGRKQYILKEVYLLPVSLATRLE